MGGGGAKKEKKRMKKGMGERQKGKKEWEREKK